METRTRCGIFILVVLVFCGAALSQHNENLSREDEPKSGLRFLAGATEFKKNPDDSVVKRFLYGVHAWTKERDSELQANEAIYNSALGETRFFGSAAFRDSSRYLNADTLIYYDATSEVEAKGKVVVTEKDRVFRTERIVYKRKERLLHTYGSIVIRDDSLKSTINGLEAVFNDSTNHGLVTGSPVLEKEDEKGSIVTVTCSDTLEIVKAERIIRLWNNVVIVKDSLRVHAGYAVYNDSTEVFTLFDTPTVYHSMFEKASDALSELKADSYITGDTIRIYLRKREVTGVDVLGKAYSNTVWKDSTEAVFAKSILEGAKMSLKMEGSMISMITAEGNATSYYFRNPADNSKMFVNEASGDTLRFFYDNGKINKLRISGYGGSGAKGKYYEFSPANTDSSHTQK